MKPSVWGQPLRLCPKPRDFRRHGSGVRWIPCSGTSVYNKEEREQWLKQLDKAFAGVRACRIFKELDFLSELREEAGKELIRETRKHSAAKILQSIPGIGPLRAGVILGFSVTPHRFRTRKQFWTYCGLAGTSKVSSEYAIIQGQVLRSKQQPLVRGLNRNYHRSLKEVFKGAAATAAMGSRRSQFDAMVANGMRAPSALLTLARKISSTTLTLWKKGEPYDEKKLKFMHAV
jgi:transposase